MRLDEYMALCLGHPEHGYYATRDPFGAGGDFVTAPEVSQMFGELVGAWAAAVWDAAGRPDPFVLAELGPGRGTLMRDALRAAAAMPGFGAAARLVLVETSPVLRARQAEALAGQAPAWVGSAAALPGGPAIVVANEFFDALPIRQFQRLDAFWRERLVGVGARAAGGRLGTAAAGRGARRALPAGARRGGGRGVAGRGGGGGGARGADRRRGGRGAHFRLRRRGGGRRHPAGAEAARARRSAGGARRGRPDRARRLRRAGGGGAAGAGLGARCRRGCSSSGSGSPRGRGRWRAAGRRRRSPPPIVA